MDFHPLKFVTGKIVRPVLRKLAGETGEQFRHDKELRRKAAVAAVAFARSAATHGKAELHGNSGSVTAWQAVTRGRSIKGRGIR